MILAILAHTPATVWLLLAFLVWQGAQALRPRTMPVWRVLLVPVIFIVTGLLPLLWRPGGTPLLVAWGAAAALSWPLGRATGPRLLAVDRPAGTVTRTGSPVPLGRNLLVFALQYGLAVAGALHAAPAEPVAVAGRLVSGATAGYFAGWAVALLSRYRAVNGSMSAQNPSSGGSPPRS